MVTFHDGVRESAVSADAFLPVSEDLVQVAVVLPSSSAGHLRNGQPIGINVVADGDHAIDRYLVRDRVAPLEDGHWRASASGLPLLRQATAWMDAVVDRAMPIDDNLAIVVAEVRTWGESSLLPLVAVRGGYGELTTSGLLVQAEHLRHELELVELFRDEMASLAVDLSARVTAQAVVGDNVIAVASAGHPSNDTAPGIRVGSRFPAVPPIGGIFHAWAEPARVERWISAFDKVPDAGPFKDRARQQLANIRDRGYSVYQRSPHMDGFWRDVQFGQLPESPATLSVAQLREISSLRQDLTTFGPMSLGEVEWMAVPVFGADGQVAMALGVEGLDYAADWDQFEGRLARMEEAVSRATRSIGGRVPRPGGTRA